MEVEEDFEATKARMLEMLDNLRADVAAGKVSGIAFAACFIENNSVITGSKAKFIVTMLGAVELLRANIADEIRAVEIVPLPTGEKQN